MSESSIEKIIQLIKLRPIKRVIKRSMIVNINNALNSGVTTLRSLGDPEFLDIALRKKVLEGKVIGPRLICAANIIGPTGGHGGPIGLVADGEWEIRKAVRTLVRKEVDVIKISSTGGVMDARMIGEAGRPQMTVEEIEAACSEAHRGGVMVASHCESTKGIREALQGGVDTIEHGAGIPDDLIEKFKNNPGAKRGYTSLIPTLAAGMGMATTPIEDTKITPVMLANGLIVLREMILGLQKAYQSGISLGAGTDAGVPLSTHYQFWKELEYYTIYTGMTPADALYFGTKSTAEVLGIDDVTGSLEVGKSADIQVVDGNPLEDITALGRVVKVVTSGYIIHDPKIKKNKNQPQINPFKI